jgi:hypothetical protein
MQFLPASEEREEIKHAPPCRSPLIVADLPPVESINARTGRSLQLIGRLANRALRSALRHPLRCTIRSCVAVGVEKRRGPQSDGGPRLLIHQVGGKSGRWKSCDSDGGTALGSTTPNVGISLRMIASTLSGNG